MRILLLALLSIGFAASAKEQVPDARLVDEQVEAADYSRVHRLPMLLQLCKEREPQW